MPIELCRDRVLRLLKSVSVPLSTSEVADRLPQDTSHNVSQVLQGLYRTHEVIRTGRGSRGRYRYRWQIQPPLVIRVYEDDTEEDRRFCRSLDIALAKRDREQRL